MTGRTVVVVDDDDMSLSTMADVMTDLGYAVRTASTGRSALQEIRAAPRPCVVIIDLMLPDLNGWQIVETLKADARTADIPIITCTAALVKNPPPTARFVGKPFSLRQIQLAVEEAFSSSEKAAAPV